MKRSNTAIPGARNFALALLLLASSGSRGQSAYQTAFDPKPYLNEGALGADAPKVLSQMQSHQFRDTDGSRPEDQLRSGDVAVYFNTPDKPVELPPDLPPPPVRPEVYERALQGFGHAALVAKDDQQKPYHLDSPMLLACNHDFRGERPYIVLRPRAAVTKNKRFAANMDLLAKKFNQIGYQYDANFNTDIMSMSPAQRSELHAKIVNWTPKSGSKPKIPDMYCSELVTTIYQMLGVPPTTDISGGDLLDRGFKKDLDAGKSKEDIARDSAHEIIAYFKTGYEYQLYSKKSLLDPDNSDLLHDGDAAKLARDVEQTQILVKQLEANESLLRDLLRSRLGLCAQNAPQTSAIENTLKAMAYYFANQKRIVRPADLLRETLSKDGSFEIAGYYAGDMASTCDQEKLDMAPTE